MKERRARKRAPKRNRGPNRARARPRTVSAARGTFEISASSSSGEAAKDDKSKSKSGGGDDDGGSHSSFSDSLLRELDAELGLLNDDDDAADNGKKEEKKAKPKATGKASRGKRKSRSKEKASAMAGVTPPAFEVRVHPELAYVSVDGAGSASRYPLDMGGETATEYATRIVKQIPVSNTLMAVCTNEFARALGRTLDSAENKAAATGTTTKECLDSAEQNLRRRIPAFMESISTAAWTASAKGNACGDRGLGSGVDTRRRFVNILRFFARNVPWVIARVRAEASRARTVQGKPLDALLAKGHVQYGAAACVTRDAMTFNTRHRYRHRHVKALDEVKVKVKAKTGESEGEQKRDEGPATSSSKFNGGTAARMAVIVAAVTRYLSRAVDLIGVVACMMGTPCMVAGSKEAVIRTPAFKDTTLAQAYGDVVRVLNGSKGGSATARGRRRTACPTRITTRAGNELIRAIVNDAKNVVMATSVVDVFVYYGAAMSNKTNIGRDMKTAVTATKAGTVSPLDVMRLVDLLEMNVGAHASRKRAPMTQDAMWAFLNDTPSHARELSLN